MLVDGKIVVDVVDIVFCFFMFECYWISVLDGRIIVGKGEFGQSIVYEWLDLSFNFKIKYVGFSSWDKYVGYRNVRVFLFVLISGKYMFNL